MNVLSPGLINTEGALSYCLAIYGTVVVGFLNSVMKGGTFKQDGISLRMSVERTKFSEFAYLRMRGCTYIFTKAADRRNLNSDYQKRQKRTAVCLGVKRT